MTSVRRFLLRCWAFVVRDFRSEASYRLYFVLQLGGLAWTLLAFWFVGRLIGSDVKELERYGGSWFSFVALGYAPLEYLRVSLFSFSSRIREAQTIGTLEALLVTPVGIPTVVFGSVAYPYAWATLRAGLLIVIGALHVGQLSTLRVGAVLVTFALAIPVFGAIGIISASFVMFFKRGDPISKVFFGTSTLFSGLFFPVEVLGRFEWIARLLPLTYAAETTRRAVRGAGIVELRAELFALALFGVVLVPLAAWAFRLALRRARRDGTLSHY